jgi:hypothetical protein
MPAERRDVLRLGGACLVGALSGCLSTEGVRIDRPSDESTPEATPEDGGDDTDDTDDTDDGPEPLEGSIGSLADATRRVVDEAAWFGTTYDDAYDDYTDALDRAIETILQLENTTAISESDLERLGEVATHVEEAIETGLEPHFELASRVRSYNEGAIERVERFGERGDRPAVNDELESLREYYERLRGLFFRQENLSKDPIRNRLVEFMAAGDPEREDEDDPVHDTLFEFRYLNPVRYVGEMRYGIRYLRGVRFRARAHTEFAVEDRDDPRLLGDPAASPAGSTRWEPTYTFPERFEPVAVSEDRSDELEVVVNDWADYDGGPLGVYTEQFVSWPIYVQRYDDFEAATAARDSLLDGPVFLEPDRTVELGDLEWEQARYRLDGEVVYALFKQFGEFVIVAAPARTPVEDRHVPSRNPGTERQVAEAVVLRDDDDDDNDDSDDPFRIPVGDVESDDTVRVGPGEVVPVDGTVTGGESVVDESSIPGGSATAEKEPDDEVVASTRNLESVLLVEPADYVEESWTLPLERSWLRIEGE